MHDACCVLVQELQITITVETHEILSVGLGSDRGVRLPIDWIDGHAVELYQFIAAGNVKADRPRRTELFINVRRSNRPRILIQHQPLGGSGGTVEEHLHESQPPRAVDRIDRSVLSGNGGSRNHQQRRCTHRTQRLTETQTN